jgi:N-acetylglucosamine malate deacetylase 2
MYLLQWECMKKSAVCIFAHPDDEAFGPSGTIHMLTKTHDVYLICATRGNAGENHHPDKKTPLEEHRKNEILASTKILGVKHVYFLGYGDGEIKNNNYHEIAADMQKVLDELRPEVLLTMEHRGISGHLDHVGVAMIASYLYERLSYVKKIMFYCLEKSQLARKPGEYFIFFPQGYDKKDINLTNDVGAMMDIKKQAIKQHVSQTKDMKHILSTLRSIEHFYTWEKK